MKFLLFFLLVATSRAQTVHDALDEAAKEVLNSFLDGMNNAEPLPQALGRPFLEGLQRVEDDVKDQLGRNMEVVLVQVIERARTVTDHNYQLYEILTEQVTEFILRVQKETAHLQDKPQEKHELVKSRVQDFKQILKNGIRDIRYGLTEVLDHLDKINLYHVAETAKNQIIETLNFHTISNYLKTVLGEAHEFATSIIAAILEKGKHLIRNIIDHFLPSPASKAVAVSKRWAFSIRTAACFIVGLITKGYGVEYIVNWIKEKVPENWKGNFLDIIAHGGRFVLKWAAKSLCLAVSPAKSSAIFNLVHKMHNILEDVGLVAQSDFFRFADWIRSVWNSGLEKAAAKFEALQETAHKVKQELQMIHTESVTGFAELFEIYRQVFGEHTDELQAAIREVLQKI